VPLALSLLGLLVGLPGPDLHGPRVLPPTAAATPAAKPVLPAVPPAAPDTPGNAPTPPAAFADAPSRLQHDTQRASGRSGMDSDGPARGARAA